MGFQGGTHGDAQEGAFRQGPTAEDGGDGLQAEESRKKQNQLQKRREKRATKMLQETPEDREGRLKVRRLKERTDRQLETEEERSTRLKKRRESHRQKQHKCLGCNAKLPRGWLKKQWKTRCWGCWKQLNA